MDWRKPIYFLWSCWAVAAGAALLLFFSCLVLVVSILGFGEKTIARVTMIWAKLTVLAMGLPAKAHGLQRLGRHENYVFASNHASAADIPVLQSVLPANFRWIAKQELFRFPIFGPALRAAGYIPLNRQSGREAIRSLQEAASRIANGASVVVFPEGTRTSDGNLREFKSGGFNLAIKSGKPVVPVYIHRSFEAMRPKSYHIVPGPIYVYFGEPISSEGYKSGEREVLAQLTREQVALLRERAFAEHPLA